MIASPYFTFDELTRSQTATRKRIDNTPSPETIANLNQLVDNVLHPLREAFGQPVLISSGYRSPILNRGNWRKPFIGSLPGRGSRFDGREYQQPRRSRLDRLATLNSSN